MKTCQVCAEFLLWGRCRRLMRSVLPPFTKHATEGQKDRSSPLGACVPIRDSLSLPAPPVISRLGRKWESEQSCSDFLLPVPPSVHWWGWGKAARGWLEAFWAFVFELFKWQVFCFIQRYCQLSNNNNNTNTGLQSQRFSVIWLLMCSVLNSGRLNLLCVSSVWALVNYAMWGIPHLE